VRQLGDLFLFPRSRSEDLMRARGCRGFVLALAAGMAAAAVPARSSQGTDPPIAATPAMEQEEVVLEDDPLFDDEDEDLLVASSERDPFEGLNRSVFSFNRGIDRYFFNPVTRGYQQAVPLRGRRAVYQFFQNLDSPVILANQMLQFRVFDSAATTTRFVINSTIGVAGMFDPAASCLRVFRSEADFGQTIARYGTPSGPYLMLPVFGPSTLRDVIGDVVDIVVDPVSYFLGPLRWYTLALGGGEGLSTRDAHLQELEELEAGSIDFYSALRSAYLQNRDAMVREAQGASEVTGIWIALTR
jgi:phospholipid-binding lipoprotein MlaA